MTSDTITQRRGRVHEPDPFEGEDDGEAAPLQIPLTPDQKASIRILEAYYAR